MKISDIIGLILIVLLFLSIPLSFWARKKELEKFDEFESWVWKTYYKKYGKNVK